MQDLAWVVRSVLAAQPSLHYYQGFHDVCAVLLTVLEDRTAAAAVAARVATQWLAPAMAPTLQPVLHQLGSVVALVRRADPALGTFLDRAGVPSFFALSWCITWFAHDVDDPAARARLFDVCLAFPPTMPYYLAAAVGALILTRARSMCSRL
jgi:TBC1 domain family member 20